MRENRKIKAPKLEKAFKKRYNRDIEILFDTEAKKDTSTLNIKTKKKTDIEITEYRVDGRTDYVIVKVGDKQYKYKRYIDAEVYVADVIGEEEE